MIESFSLTRVVTKDIITDSFQGIRNIFGLRLRGYEKMLNKHINEILIKEYFQSRAERKRFRR